MLWSMKTYPSGEKTWKNLNLYWICLMLTNNEYTRATSINVVLDSWLFTTKTLAQYTTHLSNLFIIQNNRFSDRPNEKTPVQIKTPDQRTLSEGLRCWLWTGTSLLENMHLKQVETYLRVHKKIQGTGLGCNLVLINLE